MESMGDMLAEMKVARDRYLKMLDYALSGKPIAANVDRNAMIRAIRQEVERLTTLIDRYDWRNAGN